MSVMQVRLLPCCFNGLEYRLPTTWSNARPICDNSCSISHTIYRWSGCALLCYNIVVLWIYRQFLLDSLDSLSHTHQGCFTEPKNKTKHQNVVYNGEALLGVLSNHPDMLSNYCDSFGDRAPVEGCSIFKWVAATWRDKKPGYWSLQCTAHVWGMSQTTTWCAALQGPFLLTWFKFNPSMDK